jgi:hypothetical protein|tara:strand:- start:217 stop:621 length:405 start_codon:yes stop_codon:yes gene_type:complete
MAIVSAAEEQGGAAGRVKTSDRRKRAAAARRMKNGENNSWQSLSKEDREFLANTFKEYDTDGSGTMGAAQIAPLLAALNAGEPPSAQEVDDVLSEADKDKSGKITIDELQDVINVWYRMVQKKPRKLASGCVVM